MLTDVQIKELSKRMNIPLEGVYFKDELPQNLKVNKTYIINLQDSETDEGELNSGTHWTFLQINQTPKGLNEPFYFDSYGMPPSEIIKNTVMKCFKKHLPYSKKDIQSLMNNACGFYCLGLAHFVNSSMHRKNNFYEDCDDFLDMFDDLNFKTDFKKNEYILKFFFQSPDKSKRIDMDKEGLLDTIVKEDHGSGIDMMKINVGTKMI